MAWWTCDGDGDGDGHEQSGSGVMTLGVHGVLPLISRIVGTKQSFGIVVIVSGLWNVEFGGSPGWYSCFLRSAARVTMLQIA